MKKSILKFKRTTDEAWHTVFKNRHGRSLYIKVKVTNKNYATFGDCFYLDRPGKTKPLNLKTNYCKVDDLLLVLATELDKKFYGIEFIDDTDILSTEDYIKNSLQNKKKYKFLLLVKDEDVLKTRLKNRVHRMIYLEIKTNVNQGVICRCNYCDRNYKRDNSIITPAGLTTIYFDYSLSAILKIVNTELNCDFTDVIITADTFGFDKTALPICGSI